MKSGLYSRRYLIFELESAIQRKEKVSENRSEHYIM